jgi:subtilisin family serine protease
MTRRPAHILLRALGGAALVVFLAAPAHARDLPNVPIQGVRFPVGQTGAIGDELVVQYRPGTTAAERSSIATRHGLSRISFNRDLRVELVQPNRRPTLTIRGLETEPAVASVDRNFARALAVDPTGEEFWQLQWGMHNTGQPAAGVTGTPNIDIDGLQALHLHNGGGDPSVVVAVIDDGIVLDHPDLVDRIFTNPGESGNGKESNGLDDDGNGKPDDVHGWDFCDDDNDPNPAPNPGQVGPRNGHGTHVAGTIAASLNGTGIVGVAPDVTIVPVRAFVNGSTFDCGGDATLVDAIEYAASLDVRVINASWGGPGFSAALDTAVGGSGALFVAAAGNDAVDMDNDTPYFPAASTKPNLISVAAFDQDGLIASFSNYGRTTVDIAAPGVNVASAFAPFSTSQVDCPDPCYIYLDGTSMATPHVAGVAALVVSQRIDEGLSPLSPSALRSRLMSTGRSMPEDNGLTVTDDLVNAYRAVDVAAPVTSKPNQFSLSLGSTIGSTSATAVIRWPAALDAQDRVHHYTLKKKSGSTWVTVTSSTTALLAASSVTFGKSYLWRVRSYDPIGHNSAADSPTEKPSLHQDSSSLAHYGSGWTTKSSSSASGGKTHTTSTANAQMTFTFKGRSVSIISPKSSSRGSFDVYVDNVLTATVNTNASSPKPRIVVFAKTWTSTTTHTVKIVNKATAGHPRIDIDAFVVFRTQ